VRILHSSSRRAGPAATSICQKTRCGARRFGPRKLGGARVRQLLARPRTGCRARQSRPRGNEQTTSNQLSDTQRAAATSRYLRLLYHRVDGEEARSTGHLCAQRVSTLARTCSLCLSTIWGITPCRGHSQPVCWPADPVLSGPRQRDEHPSGHGLVVSTSRQEHDRTLVFR
jgi:hypothetical protein